MRYLVIIGLAVAGISAAVCADGHAPGGLLAPIQGEVRWVCTEFERTVAPSSSPSTSADPTGENRSSLKTVPMGTNAKVLDQRLKRGGRYRHAICVRYRPVAVRSEGAIIDVVSQTWRVDEDLMVLFGDENSRSMGRLVASSSIGAVAECHIKKTGVKRRRVELVFENVGRGTAIIDLFKFPDAEYVGGVHRDAREQLNSHDHNTQEGPAHGAFTEQDVILVIDLDQFTIYLEVDVVDRWLVGNLGLTRAGVSVSGMLGRILGWIAAILATLLGAPHLYRVVLRKPRKHEEGEERDYTLPYATGGRSALLLRGDPDFKPPSNLHLIGRQHEHKST